MTVEDQILMTQVHSGKRKLWVFCLSATSASSLISRKNSSAIAEDLRTTATQRAWLRQALGRRLYFDQQEIGTLIEDTYLQSSIPIASPVSV